VGYHVPLVLCKPCCGLPLTTASVSSHALAYHVPLVLYQATIWTVTYHWSCVKPWSGLPSSIGSVSSHDLDLLYTGSVPSQDLDYHVLLVVSRHTLDFQVPLILCQPCSGLPFIAGSVSNHILNYHVLLLLCQTMLWTTLYQWFCVKPHSKLPSSLPVLLSQTIFWTNMYNWLCWYLQSLIPCALYNRLFKVCKPQLWSVENRKLIINVYMKLKISRI
jgi:hypothetical protein